jgi:hypothetical protein
MKTFAEFIAEAYDKDVMGSSQIRKTGEGGRIGAERKKTEPEKRRMKAAGGGKMVPAKSYKSRSDIGQQRQASTRVQQPEQERGSAREKQLAAAKEERRKAAQARIAARKAGKTADTESKPKAKEAEKAATQLLSKKKPEAPKAAAKPRRKWEHETGGGMTRAERDRARNKEKAEALKKRKAELIKDFTEKHGRAPKGKERTKLLGLAHGTVKAGV